MREVRGYILVMVAAMFWGVSATGAKFLLNQNLGTILIVQTRVTISFLLLFAGYFLFRRDFFRVDPRDLYRFALLGVCGVGGANFTYYFTIKESTVATAILLQYTAPLLVLGYAALSREEELTPVKFAAAGVSLLGCFFAVGAYDLDTLRLTPIGLVSGVGSVVTYAFMTIYIRHLVMKYSVWTVTMYTFAFASLFWLVVNPPWVVAAAGISGETWGALGLLAVTSVLIPHTAFFSGLRYVVPARAVITSTLEPVVAIASAALFLGERLNSLQMIGAILVLGAIVTLQLKREHPGNVQPGKGNDAA
jgi:drug/metabolite transporter (DMT)-like permease